MRIVLASAQLDLRVALEILLREEPGLVVVGTSSGSGGLLALIEATQPDLAIVDWDLPGRPVSDVLAQANALAETLAFIILGTQSNVEPVALAAGAQAFFRKGSPPKRLLSAIQRLSSSPEAGEAQVQAREE